MMRLIVALRLSLVCAQQVAAQTGATASAVTPPRTTGNSTIPPTITTGSASTASAPDVYLNVPTLSVGKIELVVEDLSADININANVAQLVQINAGVQIGITKVNLTIVDVDAQVELSVRLGHLVDIVNRVFQSLDLNPLLINTLNNVTSLTKGAIGDVVGAVDGLLGSITQGGTTLNFVVDNFGNNVQEVGGVSSIVGNYLQNMSHTGQSTSVGQGLTQKVYSYSPLNALADIGKHEVSFERLRAVLTTFSVQLRWPDSPGNHSKADRQQQQLLEHRSRYKHRPRYVTW